MSIFITCEGRIGRDADLRTTKKGDPMVLSSIAVDVTAYNATMKQTMWISLVGFGDSAELMGLLRKGDTAAVSGFLTQKSYVAKDGSKQTGFSLNVETVIDHEPKAGNKAKPAASTPKSNNPIPF